MLSTAFLMHPEVYNQVDRQECVRVDLGTGVTQKLSTDFIRVVPQTSRNQFALYRLLRRLFMPVAKETSFVRSPMPTVSKVRGAHSSPYHPAIILAGNTV